MALTLKILKYIAIRILLVAAILGLLFGAFISSMNTTNVFVLITDGMKKRTDVVLLQQDINTMSKYFTKNFMDTDNYGQIQQSYDNYIINNYGYKLNIKNAFTWPWQNSRTVIVQEAVYSIDGTLNTIKLTKDEAIRLNKLNPPDWNNSVYKVHLVNTDGKWLIDSIKIVGEYNYTLPPLRSLPPDVLASLRPTQPPVTITPSPVPTTAVVSSGTVNSTLNVRKGASTNFEVIATLKSGDKVEILSEEGTWFKIRFGNGQEGFASKNYITVD